MIVIIDHNAHSPPPAQLRRVLGPRRRRRREVYLLRGVAHELAQVHLLHDLAGSEAVAAAQQVCQAQIDWISPETVRDHVELTLVSMRGLWI